MINNATTVLSVVVADKDYNLNFTLQDAAGVAVDLTGATLTFEAQLVSDFDVNFDGTMVVGSAPAGTCAYNVVATDFPVAGLYNCQVIVDYLVVGKRITFDNIQITAIARVPQ